MAELLVFGIPTVALIILGCIIAHRAGKKDIPEFDGGYSHDGYSHDGIRITRIRSDSVRTDQ